MLYIIYRGVVETYTMEYRNYWSPFITIKSGTTTKTTAKAVKDLVLTAVGMANVYGSIFGGISAYLAYENATSSTIGVGKPNDYMQASFKLDYLEKTSAVQTPAGLMTGCISKKIWIDKVKYRQVYASVNSSYCELTRTINKAIKSKSWDNSANIALYNWTSPIVDADIIVMIGSKTYKFGNVS